MLLSAKQMQSIVDEIGDTINQNVNIMNEEGYIIASKDASRIGMLHKGAKKIIEEKLDIEIISEEDSDLETRPGINYPLIVNQQVVGVVGITGDYEEIGILGEVIQRMTEMLIMDRYRSSMKRMQENLRKNMAVEWLFGKDKENLKDSSSVLGIDIQMKRRIVVSEVVFSAEKEKNSIQIQEEYEEITKQFRQKIESNPQQVVLSMGNRNILFLMDEPSVLNTAKKVITNVEKKFSCRIYSGIGTPGSGKQGVVQSYKTADAACALVRQLRDMRIMEYDDTDLRFLLSSVPAEKQKNYLEKIWGGCIQKEREEMIQYLQVYIKNEGSLSKTAEELFIHKNTLQYRLAKIKSVTGYDPRKLNEAIYLHIAIILSELTE